MRECRAAGANSGVSGLTKEGGTEMLGPPSGAPHIAVQLLECLQARMLPGLLSLLKRQLDPEPRCAGSGASWLGILAPSLASWVALGRQLATPGPLLLNIFTKMKGEDVCAVFCPASGMW